MADKYTRAQLAQRIKEKHPQYAEMDDNELVDKIIAKYPQYGEQLSDEGKITEPQEDATAVQGDTASSSEDTSSESPELTQEQSNAVAQATRDAIGATTRLPDFIIEPTLSFLGTLGDFGSGIAAAVEQVALQRARGLAEDGVDVTANATDKQKKTFEGLESASPEERLAAFEEWSVMSNNIEESLETIHGGVGQYGTGSISTDFADGNYADAAKSTVNQTASGLASLVPFFIPGGQILGPAILGGSTVGSSFKEDIRDIEKTGNATLDQIALASYIKGGAEFATEFVTGGILGRAKKLASGGASKAAVGDFTRAAWKSVLGDSFSEFVAEGATDTANRATDHFIYGTPWDGKAALTGFIDAGIVGAIVGGKVSTFGQLSKPGNKAAKDIAANALKTTEQQNADKADLETIQDAQKVIDEKKSLGLEASLIDSVVEGEAKSAQAEAVQRIKDRQDNHVKTLEDMTEAELKEYADAKDKADKLEAEKKELEKANIEVPAAVNDKINEHRQKQGDTYSTVENWNETTKAINTVVDNNKDKVKEIEQEESNIALEEKQAAKAEQPNPVGTQKRKQRAAKLKKEKAAAQKNIDQLEKVKDQARPGTLDAKGRQLEKANNRANANEELATLLADPSIPASQKEKAYKQVFKNNAPLIGQIAGQIASKNGVNKKEVSDLLKSEIARRIQETGKIDKNTWNTAQKAVDRLVKKEKETVTRNKKGSAQLKEDLQEITDQVADGILDPEAAEILKEDIRREHDAEQGGATTSLTFEGAEGDVQVKSEVEKATKPKPSGKSEASLVAKLLEGTSVDQLFDTLKGNTDKIFALLPSSATNGRAFSGIFANGNPAPEIWDSYFDKSDETGRKRFNRLKKAVKDRVAETEADSENSTGSDFMQGAFDFLEGDKNSVKKFLPLLAKLKRAFPGVKIVISKARMIEDFIEAGIDPGRADNIKGYTDGSTVVLNPDKLDLETPIHEFGHLWAQATRSARPELYRKGVELLKKSKYWTDIVAKSKDEGSIYFGHSQQRLEEEAMATAIGKTGEQLYDKESDVSTWNKLVSDIKTWLSEQMGVGSIDNLTLDQFLKIATSEIITGEKVITAETAAVLENSLIINALEVPVGTTKDYTPSTKPAAEVDTHGVFNGKALRKEALNKINKYWSELQNGGWIGYTTGTYGDIVRGTAKFNAKINAKIEAKVKGLKEEFAKEGFSFTQDPKNPGIHIVKKQLSFSEGRVTYDAQQDHALKNVQAKIADALAPPDPRAVHKHSGISQDVREALESTKIDLKKRGGSLSLSELAALDGAITREIAKGQDFISGVKEAQEAATTEQQEQSNQLLEDSPEDSPSYKDRDKLLNKLKRTKFSNLLAPASNNDFEGLLYRMLPKGKTRLAAKKLIDKLLLDPLAKANATHLNWKDTLRNQWEANRAKLGKHKVNEDSGITLDNKKGSYKMTKGEVIKAYNYAKDPNIYGQLERGGFDTDKINEIVDYMHKPENAGLRDYANGVSETYASVAPAINSKLNQHGRQTFTAPRIDADLLTPEQKEIMEKVYGSPIPSFAVYTPVTATGQDLDTEVSNLLDKGNYDLYTVMDGRLKNRTGAGIIEVAGTNPEADFENYLRGPVRTLAFMDFAQNASNFFGKDQIAAMKIKYGDTWQDAMKDSLKRIVSGRNTPTRDTGASNFIQRTLQRQVGGIMFLNVRSGLLQHLSYFNYMFDDLTAVRRGWGPISKEVKDKVYNKMKPYLSDRGRGRTELLVDDIFERGGGGLIDKAIEKGYSITKWGDKNSISFGGGQYMAGKYLGYLDQGLSDQEALDKAYSDFIKSTDSSQQSTNPEKLGKEQTTTIGRYILAFANTPQQYNRKISKAIQDLRGLKGDSSPEANKRKKQAIAEITWYLGAQNAIFTSLQTLAFAGFGLDAGDEDERALNWTNSLVNTILRGAGIYGALTAAAKDAIIAVSRDKDVVRSIVNAIPSVGNLIKNIQVAAGQKAVYARSELTSDIGSKELYQASAAATALGVPANKALKVIEQVSDIVASDLSAMERLARSAGYERYQIDANAGGPLKRLNKGEAGQANKDGTIEVDPNLSPEEKHKTIQHEEKHVRDMENGKLDYTDNSLTYNGKTYERKGGKINYNGKWLKEGSKEFPWEKAAYNAETPLSKDGDSRRNIEEHDREADEFTAEHFNDPNTRSRLKEQTGLSDAEIDKRVKEATGTKVEQNAFLEQGDAEYNAPGRFFGEVIPEGEPGYSPGNIQVGVDLNEDANKGTLEHEQAHALGFDDQLGLKAQEILGKAKHDRYLDQPGETYGNIQEFRKILGIKPWERDLTPEKIKELVEFNEAGDQEDVKQLLNNYDIGKLSKALNTIAENNIMRPRQDNSALARLKTMYS